MTHRTLVVTDWPPTTLATSYKLEDLMLPSSCQKLFDDDTTRPRVRKCTVASCPLRTVSRFTSGLTQTHWAHQSPAFLELPPAWSQLDWLSWWRALTQYLFQPSAALLDGMASTLSRSSLLRSPIRPEASPRARADRLLRRASNATRGAHALPSRLRGVSGFAERFGKGVASWGDVARPLVGLHVRLGDGCHDAKRGGCKYVKSFAQAVTRLREAGITGGTIFLATDSPKVAEEAVGAESEGFEVVALKEDRATIESSHSRSERRREGDELLHLQLLDLGLLSQADVLAGVFGSTFVKSALQLGNAGAYVTLDTFPWCPLLRCYWLWRDLCHNCEVCTNQAGGGEACTSNGYHTATGVLRALRDRRPASSAFRRFMRAAERSAHCRSFADHPLQTTMFDAPVTGAAFAPTVPALPFPQEQCADEGGDISRVGGANCSCGFRRFTGVDNAAASYLKPFYGYGSSVVRFEPARPSLSECERRCCREITCHSVVWDNASSTCVASLSISHGARADDWCWRPTLRKDAITSIRLPGKWQVRAC
ncbi:MAG: hypothetical protein SGPRY_012145 [Prymnesium sp.]